MRIAVFVLVVMRLAIISDVHGNLPALDIVLADMRQRSPDAIINLGDVATGPLWPVETVERLGALSVEGIRGNHDRWLSEPGPHDAHPSVRHTRAALGIERCAALHALPATREIDGDVLAVHGTPSSDMTYLLEDDVYGRLLPCTTETLGERLAGVRATLVLCGHSHRQMIASAPGCLVVNPGAVGGPRFTDNADPCVAEAGTRHACYGVATRERGTWRVELVALPYDWSFVVRRARENGRESWGAAFMRGDVS